MAHLLHAGWAVPEILGDPFRAEGAQFQLMSLLPGSPKARADSDERLTRGRLLARLHDTLASFPSTQRTGFSTSDQLVRRTELIDALRAYEQVDSRVAYIMLWHLDRVREGFETVPLGDADKLTLHGDFAVWNLLFEGDQLSGILDFEATHLNYRAADFALSWRGHQDEVVEGYEDVHPLSDLDWELLGLCYWSWLFIGIEEKIDAILQGSPGRDLEWHVTHLLRRPGLPRFSLPSFPDGRL